MKLVEFLATLMCDESMRNLLGLFALQIGLNILDRAVDDFQSPGHADRIIGLTCLHFAPNNHALLRIVSPASQPFLPIR
jgi:hypothetical protein